ncbi:MAG: hypothetical protein J5I93_23330 [Pirellulaceae bacterium]|nr:hypothetical protein [Pirellulaceae bacterium]
MRFRPLRLVRRAARQLGLMVVHAVVLASLWQAPVVWLHRHSEADHTSESQDWHLADYHATGVTRPLDHESGWHLHWAFAEDIARGGGMPVQSDSESSDSPGRSSNPLAPPGSGVPSVQDAPASTPWNLADCVVPAGMPGTLAGREEASRTTQPLASFCHSGLLLTLLCVARC